MRVDVAETADIERLLELEGALFREDAGRFDPHADVEWPQREGRADIEELMASPDAVVFAGRAEEQTVGLLMGYATTASATRQPVRYAVLRTLFVDPDHRSGGMGALMIEAFVDWARAHDCVSVDVSHFAANEGAGRLYDRMGFKAQSVTRLLDLR